MRAIEEDNDDLRDTLVGCVEALTRSDWPAGDLEVVARGVVEGLAHPPGRAFDLHREQVGPAGVRPAAATAAPRSWRNAICRKSARATNASSGSIFPP